MISAVTGTLDRVADDRAHLRVGPITLELLIPAADAEALRASVEESVTFHTMAYVEGEPGGGSLVPRLIGFRRETDRRFFEKFITVKGIGPRKALKALVVSAGEVAAAIEARDARALIKLPAVGKRMAEQIIAELAGKVAAFAHGIEFDGESPRPSGRSLTPAEQDATDALIVLGERRPDAERLLERAKASNPELTETDALVREMLRLRGVRG